MQNGGRQTQLVIVRLECAAAPGAVPPRSGHVRDRESYRVPLRLGYLWRVSVLGIMVHV